LPPSAQPKRFSPLGIFGYVALLALGVAVVLAVQALARYWNFEPSNAAQVNDKAPAATMDLMLHVLATLAAVILVGAVLGRLCRYIGQPPVIGEILAGIALGPSLLGYFSPELMEFLIPHQAVDPNELVLSSLKVISQLGVILYMFLVGLELNASHLKHKAHAAIAISHTSIVVPFALGVILALWLYPLVSEPNVSFLSFSLFIGVALSITAFPVLARILTDRKMHDTPIGTIALSCAAADDVTAWCLLALVVGVAKSDLASATFVIAGAAVFIAMMFLAARPAMVKYTQWLDRDDHKLPQHAIAFAYFLLLLAAATTEWIGVHAIFGAFLLGVTIPSESRLAASFLLRLKEPVTVLLLPAFFAYTGMRTNLGLLQTGDQWLICAVIFLVATLGKWGGTLIAARLTGESWRDSHLLGALMNTRGLMGLIVLNIGFDMGVIGPTLFAMMAIVAIATTMMTSPIVAWLYQESRFHAKC
jgi:Kef-type K+ transport system membrane component KefB